MKKQIFAAIFAAVVGLGASEANAQAPSGPSVVPGLNVTPYPGMTVLAPSLGVNVPLGGGSSVQGTLTVPVVVPNSGPPQVSPPTGNVQFIIPLGK